MSAWREDALILRCGHFREADLWLRVLLKHRGLQTIFAFGGAKSLRRFCGCLDQLNTIDCSIKESRNGEYFNLQEARLIAAPINLRTNWRAMGLAANCMKFMEACGIGPESAHECFLLMEDLRSLLEEKVSGLIPLFFRLRLAASLGYAPDFEYCAKCGASLQKTACFKIDAGQTICASCNQSAGFINRRRELNLSPAALDVLQKVQHNLPRSWPLTANTDADLRQASQAIDGFIQFHLGLEWDNGNFRRI